MHKTDLIAKVAEATEQSKTEVGRTLDATLAAITEALKTDEDVTLIGFGTFCVRQRAARNGRNPQTGKVIKIKATKVPAFRAGKGLKEAVAPQPAKKATKKTKSA